MPFPYAPIARHAVIGDRRTAALVAADGTVDWWCAPDYSSEPLFASLLDADRGGYFRFGPLVPSWGRQRYVRRTAIVETHFALSSGLLVATDLMRLDEPERREGGSAIVRRLAARRGSVRCLYALAPRFDSTNWRAFCTHAPATAATSEFVLREGDEAWAVIEYGPVAGEWSVARARRVADETAASWSRWSELLHVGCGLYDDRVRRSLLTIRLLTYASSGTAVAAPTTSLPGRIGGGENWDYRLSWVRDNSLAMAALAMHGDLESARRYFDWLESLASSTEAPLQVLYGIDGRTEVVERTRGDFAGYRESRPVRFGNRARGQRQPGTMGYLADCAAIYHAHGSSWRNDYFELVARCADWVSAHWQEPDNGIWELTESRHYVSSRVMCWVALARAVDLARALRHPRDTARWREAMNAVHAETLEKGFSDRRGAFIHAYGVEALDAATLLIPLMGFLPPDDPRVRSTVDRIASDLTIDGLTHRFAPREIGLSTLPLGEFEGAFIPCTCWLAAAYAMDGRVALAERTLERVDRAVGDLGLMPEAIDVRSGAFRGNFPLLFSHAEYVRAVVELGRARSLSIRASAWPRVSRPPRSR